MIRCKKCSHTFTPDASAKKVWSCPACHTVNTHLRRHYRSVADFFILGLIFGLIGFGHLLATASFNPLFLLIGIHICLMLTAIIMIYRAPEPWKDSPAKTMIWIVLASAFIGNFVLPFLLTGTFSYPLLVVYSIILYYVLWLRRQTTLCSV